MNKKLTALITALSLWLCSCSVFYDESSAETSAEYVSIDHAYDGADEILGRQYGNKFRMCYKIERQEFGAIYEIDFNTVQNYDNDLDNAKELFGKLVGDAFDESNLEKGDHNVISYKGNGYGGTAVGGMVHAYRLETEGLFGGDSELTDKMLSVLYRSDEQLHFKTPMTVSELAGKAMEEYSRFRPAANRDDFSRVPYDVYERTDGITYEVFVDLAHTLDGIPVQYDVSPYDGIDPSVGYSADEGMTYFFFYNDRLVFGGSGELVQLTLEHPLTILEKRESDKMLSVSAAADILRRKLADNTAFTVTRVELEYCCLVKQPELDYTDPEKAKEADRLAAEYDASTRTLVPCWCFFINDAAGTERGVLKVNALNGKVFVDISGCVNKWM